MNEWEEMLNAFVDSFIENDCAEDALRLKWQKTTL